MTHLIVAGGLGRAFRGSTQASVYQKFFLRQQEERERRERREDVKDDAAEIADIAMSTITVLEASEFRFELDTYDAATIDALQANEEALVLSRERLDKF